MKKKKIVISENYLERIPVRIDSIGWSTDSEGIVTLEIENKGIFNTIAQKLFKKPKISYVHLDEMGSFLWPYLDGEKTVFEFGELVSQKFGDNAEPLYPRLIKYFQILDSYNFIQWNNQ